MIDSRIRASGLALVFALGGCSSGDFATAPVGEAGPTEDGATDTAAVDGTKTDTASLCVTPPSAVAGEGDFCNFEATLFSRCGQCESCRQTNLNSCVSFGDALSNAFKGALLACRDTLACGDYTTYAADPCVREKAFGAKPTKAQQAAKDAYCAACPANKAECEAFFDVGGGDAGPDAGTRGIGAVVLIANDAIDKTIADQCSGALNCNPGLYYLCSAAKFCNQTAPDACKSGFCGK